MGALSGTVWTTAITQMSLAIGLVFLTPTANAVVAAQPLVADDLLFPVPAYVQAQVRFWEKIFYKFPSSTVLIHESADPDRIVDIVNADAVRMELAPGQVPTRQSRDAFSARYLKRYTKAVDHFAAEQVGALRYGAIEQRLYDVFSTSPAALARLYRGDVKLRAQTGLADDFLKAATTAQSYLPLMEQIFTSYAVPTRLTRLPFVESMFNLKARSKVGASGIWQFMPATARNFIFVNRLVDERNAPEKATRAAARFLLGNYRELGSWPLAITAYNHGKAGMAQASRQLATQDIEPILRSYSSPSFGFASRNFYAEFLAAAGTYDRLLRQRRIPPAEPRVATVSVILKDSYTVTQLLKLTGLRRETLAALNPCLLPSTLTTYAHKMLPPFYELRVPLTQARAIKLALATAAAKRYATR